MSIMMHCSKLIFSFPADGIVAKFFELPLHKGKCTLHVLLIFVELHKIERINLRAKNLSDFITFS